MDRIRLPRAGRERLFLTLHAEPPFGPAATVEVQFGTGSWHLASTTVSGTTVTAELLVAGPDFADPLDGAVQITEDSLVRYRLSDAPEVLFRGGSFLALTD